MKKLAESSGVAAYEVGNKLYLSRRPAQWTTVFVFVAGLLTLITLVNGIIQLMAPSSSSNLGLILTGAALIFGLIFWKVWMYHKKIKALPLNELKNICVLDFGSNTLFDNQQNALAPINMIWMAHKMQIGSSSPELLIRWDGGYISVVKGNPFAGSIENIKSALISKGIRMSNIR